MLLKKVTFLFIEIINSKRNEGKNKFTDRRGGGVKDEKLNISLTSNQTSHSDLLGAIIKVSHPGGVTEYAWEGHEITVNIPPYVEYSVEYTNVSGYKTPEKFISTAVADNSRTIIAEYKTCVLSVVIADNQSSLNDIANATATVAANGITTQTVKNGGIVKVPTGASCTITWSALTDYRTPSVQTFTASSSAVTKTGTYQTEVVSVSLSSSNNSSVNGISVTINGKAYTWNGTTITQKVAFGTSYSVRVGELNGYISPESKSFTADSVSRYVDMQYKYNPAKDLSMFDIYDNPINQTTANCYVVSRADTYKIPLVFGNALKNGSTNSAAYTKNSGSYSHDFVDYNGTKVTSPYIENVSGTAYSAQLSISDTNGIFTDISIIDGSPCRYLQFKVNSIPTTGANGVLSIKNSSGVIMWSWHIWVWADSLAPVEIVSSTGVAYNILPVNLASKWDDTAKTKIKNWFYQFGRPNPMLCPSAYNSTSNHASYGSLGFTTASAASHLYKGIQNPTTFFKYKNSYYDWFDTNSGKTYNLWDAACTSTGNDNNVVKTIYDPCPIGFKVPNGNTFTGLSNSNVVGSFANGWKFKRYSGDIVGVFFPASGHWDFSSGLLLSVGSEGRVWTSSAESQSHAYNLLLNSTYVYLQTNNPRSSGCSVRPVQDTSIEGQNRCTKIRIDQTITDPEAMITRIVDLGGIEAIRANSHRYVGTFANEVMTLKQLNDSNGYEYVNGTNASTDIRTQGKDVWMKLPQFYWKCTKYANYVWDFEVVFGAKPDDTYKEWDGNDLIGVYEAFTYQGKAYSVSDQVSQGNMSQAQFKSYAKGRGTGFSLVKWKHHCMMAMLYYTMYGNTNCQAKIGKGTDSYEKSTGATNLLGMTDTVAGGNGDSNSINFWGLENWWGNKYEWIDNIVVDSRVWKITEDDGTVRQAGTGGSSSGWISQLLFNENIDLIPKVVLGSETSGFCDYYSQSSPNSLVVLRSSGKALSDGGVTYVDAFSGSSYAYLSYGSRLAFRGNIVIE